MLMVKMLMLWNEIWLFGPNRWTLHLQIQNPFSNHQRKKKIRKSKFSFKKLLEFFTNMGNFFNLKQIINTLLFIRLYSANVTVVLSSSTKIFSKSKKFVIQWIDSNWIILKFFFINTFYITFCKKFYLRNNNCFQF